MLSSSSVVIEIGHYSEQTETPDPVADMRETIIAELCMSLYGTSDGKYYFDEEKIFIKEDNIGFVNIYYAPCMEYEIYSDENITQIDIKTKK